MFPKIIPIALTVSIKMFYLKVYDVIVRIQIIERFIFEKGKKKKTFLSSVPH